MCVNKCHPDDLGLLIFKTSMMIKRQVDTNHNLHVFHEVTGKDGWILHYLQVQEEEGKDIYQKDLERLFSNTPSAISKAIKNMEKKGFVQRTAVLNDARLKKVSLTEEGKRISQLAREEQLMLEKKIMNDFSSDEIAAFKQMLNKVIVNLSDDATEYRMEE